LERPFVAGVDAQAASGAGGFVNGDDLSFHVFSWFF
jgi:hypothetical protein